MPFEIVGVPKDLGGARALALADKYEFQKWALSQIQAQPYKGGKKGGDGGVDGYLYFKPDGKKTEKAIVSVKGGQSLNPAMVKDLIVTVDQEGAKDGRVPDARSRQPRAWSRWLLRQVSTSPTTARFPKSRSSRSNNCSSQPIRCACPGRTRPASKRRSAKPPFRESWNYDCYCPPPFIPPRRMNGGRDAPTSTPVPHPEPLLKNEAQTSLPPLVAGREDRVAGRVGGDTNSVCRKMRPEQAIFEAPQTLTESNTPHPTSLPAINGGRDAPKHQKESIAS